MFCFQTSLRAFKNAICWKQGDIVGDEIIRFDGQDIGNNQVSSKEKQEEALPTLGEHGLQSKPKYCRIWKQANLAPSFLSCLPPQCCISKKFC